MITSSVNTGQKHDTRFKLGQSGNPSGRPKGSRNRISETLLNALADDFDQHGAAVIEQVRLERPHDYLKVCTSVIPKRLENEEVGQKSVREMTDAELEAIIWKSAEAMRGISEEEIAAAEVRIAEGVGSLVELAPARSSDPTKVK